MKKYENGMKFSCGPPLSAGAYKKWNWCSVCSSIFDKDHFRCPECHQTLRWKARSAQRWGQKTLE